MTASDRETRREERARDRAARRQAREKGLFAKPRGCPACAAKRAALMEKIKQRDLQGAITEATEGVSMLLKGKHE